MFVNVCDRRLLFAIGCCVLFNDWGPVTRGKMPGDLIRKGLFLQLSRRRLQNLRCIHFFLLRLIIIEGNIEHFLSHLGTLASLLTLITDAIHTYIGTRIMSVLSVLSLLSVLLSYT